MPSLPLFLLSLLSLRITFVNGCATPAQPLPSWLLGTTWKTPFVSSGFSGYDYLTFSTTGASQVHNIVALAGTTCLPIMMSQCVTSAIVMTVPNSSPPSTYLAVNYTQAAFVSEKPIGCIALLAGFDNATGTALLYSTRVALTQLCLAPSATLEESAPALQSSSTWVKVSGPGACPSRAEIETFTVNATPSTYAIGDPTAVAYGVGLGVGLGFAVPILFVFLAFMFNRLSIVAEFVGVASPPPLGKSSCGSSGGIDTETAAIVIRSPAPFPSPLPPLPPSDIYVPLFKTRISRHAMTLVLSPPQNENEIGACEFLKSLPATARLDSCDNHLPSLTVKETLEFASSGDNAHAQAAHTAVALGLSECWATRIGSEDIRGVSGGQRRRVSLAETLLSLNAMDSSPLVTLDGATTGLDAASSVAVMAHVRNAVIDTRGGTVIAALLQPTPQVLGLFDAVILLRDGHVLWSGPPSQLVAACEAATSRKCPPQCEAAEFAVSVLANGEWKTSTTNVKHDVNDDASILHNNKIQTNNRRYLPFISLLSRQVKLVLRDGGALGHAITASVVGALLASIFPAPPLTSFNLRLSVMLFACFALAFFNLPIVATFAAQRRVAQRQVNNGFYSSTTFAMVALLAHLPVVALESALLAASIYHGVGFASDSGHFSFFYLNLFLADAAMCALYLLLALLLPSGSAAQSLAVPLTGVALLFSGFLATRQQIPDWLTPLYYGSPFSWMLQSLAINEFTSVAYMIQPPGLTGTTFSEIYLNVFEFRNQWSWAWAGVGYNIAFILLATIVSGFVFARRGSDDTNIIDKITGGFLRVVTKGGRKNTSTTNATANPSSSSSITAASSTSTTLSPTLPPGASLSFENISYTITVPSSNVASAATTTPKSAAAIIGNNFSVAIASIFGATFRLCGAGIGGGQERMLLRSVNGRAEPGTLTAILGASGAGKSTLLDVLLGLKTVGTVTGQIIFCGEIVDKTNGLSRRPGVGYVQQADLHEPTSTVREALEFAVALRGSGAGEEADKICAWVLESLALTAVANHSIRDLTAGETKRLTIAVELAARPALLLLDEPTSGLDSSEALRVVTLLRALAFKSGTTIIAAIHAPSHEVYSLFDQAMFLAPGGYLVYSGAIGGEGNGFTPILESAAKVLALPFPEKLSEGNNSASWVLGAVKTLIHGKGGGIGTGQVGQSLADAFNATSSVRQTPTSPTSSSSILSHPRSVLPPLFTQLYALLPRAFRASIRDRLHQPARFIAIVIMSAFFGALFENLKRDTAGAVETALSVWWMALVMLGLVLFATSLPAAFRGRAIAVREAASGMLSPSVAAFTGLVAEIPWVALCTTAACSIIAPLVAPRGEALVASGFLAFWVAMFLIALIMVSLAHLFALAAPTLPLAQSAGFLAQAILLLFGGLLVPAPFLPDGWRWLMIANPIKHAADAVWASQFYCESKAGEGNPCRTFLQNPVPAPINEWPFIVGWLGLQDTNVSHELLILLPFLAVFSFAVLVAARINWLKR
jgi:ABC-type multidrug transport system ATPase subunit/ABC-type multidrug transport system permease subunit